MSPPFFFRIDEFTEHPDVAEQVNENGTWIPWSQPGYNIRIQGGVSGQWWFCDRNKIRLAPGWSPAEDTVPYKTFSTIYSDGHGFHVLNGDATNPPAAEVWHHLWFDWDDTTLSSALTNAGTRRRLRVQNPSAVWPKMLLPDIYHGPAYSAPGYGGLTGDLPIFLALMAFSMKPDRLPTQLPKLMRNGDWVTHERSHGRVDKRGLIVYVYAYNGNKDELEGYEDGSYGNYFN